ncbi:hypothetical protein MHYP_G00278560 [Metynnis hypsauchen]
MSRSDWSGRLQGPFKGSCRRSSRSPFPASAREEGWLNVHVLLEAWCFWSRGMVLGRYQPPSSHYKIYLQNIGLQLRI